MGLQRGHRRVEAGARRSADARHAPGALLRRARGVLAGLLVALWTLAVPQPVLAAALQMVSAAELATIGLADVEQREVLRICFPIDVVKGKTVGLRIAVEFEVFLEPKFEGAAQYLVGPVQFTPAYRDLLCVSNRDFRLEGKALNTGRFDERIRDLRNRGQLTFSGEQVPVRTETPLPEQHPNAEQVVNDIIARGGILPEFDITLTFELVEMMGDVVGSPLLSEPPVRLVNTNPRPVALEFPREGEAIETVRPPFRLVIPEVPTDISHLELTLTVEDRTDSTGSWRSPVGMTLTPAQYGATLAVPYPSREADLIPGHEYRVTARLVDPAQKVVGVGARDEGEAAEFSVAVQTLVAERPEAGEPLRTLQPVVEWSDPNPGGVRAAFSGYRVSFSEQASMDGAWSVDVGLSTSYRYSDPARALQPGARLFWQVVPLSRLGVPIEAAASAVRELRLEPLPRVQVTQPPGGATFAEREAVTLEVGELPEWSPGLEVEWFDQGVRIGSGLSLSREFSPGEHSVYAEVFLPGLPGLRSQSEPVSFSVARSLGSPTLSGIEARFLFFESPTAVAGIPDTVGGVPPYSLRLLLSGSGRAGEELAAREGLGAGSSLEVALPVLAPGSYELRAVLQDARGDERESVRTIEAVAPAFSVRAVSADGIGGVNFLVSDTVLLSLAVQDPVSGRALDPSGLPFTYRWQVGRASFEGPGPVTLSPSEVGAGSVDAEAVVGHGVVGEVGRASLTLYISAVDLAPALGPLQAAYLLGQAVPVEVSFSADGQAPFTVELYDDGRSVARLQGLQAPPARFELGGLGEGLHRLSARVSDSSSNTAATGVAEFRVGAPRLDRFAVLDDAGLERSGAEAGEALHVEATVDWTAAGGATGSLAEFVREFPFYAVELVAAGPAGGPTVLASTPEGLQGLRFSPAPFAGPGEEMSLALRLLLQPSGTLVGERSVRLGVREAVVPVNLALPAGAGFEVPREAAGAEVPVELLVGRSGRYRGVVEALPATPEGEARPGEPPIRYDMGEFEVPPGAVPGRIPAALNLPAGHYAVRGSVEAVEVPGVAAGGRFDTQPWLVRVTRARVTEAAVQVLSPVEGRYSAGSPIPFEGRAVNPFGDDVSEQLVWRREPGGGELGRGPRFQLQLPEGSYTVTATVTAEGETVSASVRFEVFDVQEPAVALVQSADTSRGAIYRLLDGGAESRLSEGSILLSGWVVEARGNPGVSAGTEIGRLLVVRPASVRESRTASEEHAGARGLGSGETLALRAGFTYLIVAQGD